MEFGEAIRWEATQKPGDVVEVRWTQGSGGLRYRARATIVKFNDCSVRVRLLEDVPWQLMRGWVYRKGLFMTVPTTVKFGTSCVTGRWTPHHGIFPLEVSAFRRA